MIDVVAAMIWHNGRFLLCQRPAAKARGLKWEFAGGKVEPGESPEDAIVRECKEELNLTISAESRCLIVTHSYPDVSIRLILFNCTIYPVFLSL